MISLSIDSREMQRFINNIDKFEASKQEAIRKEIARASYSIQKQAKEEAPFKKGFLRNSIDVIIKAGGVTGQVIVKRNYGIFVHEGTRPHDIYPRNGKVLAWRSIISQSIKTKRNKYSNWVYASKVHHPGTKANPFLARAADKERPIYQQNLINLMNR
jgi:HK97 gp10 family phage protein